MTTISTELQTQDLEFPVNLKPAEITFGNFDEMKKWLTDYAATYKDVVITEQTFKDDKKVRAQMRALKKKIDDRRITIKRDVNKPLDEFEGKVKELTTILDNVIGPIDKGIKFYDQAVKDKKKQHVIQLITDLTESNNLIVNAIQFNNKWLNATSTDKNVVEEVNAQIDAINAEQARLDGERLIITNYAKAVELDSQGWLAMVNDGKSAAEVMKLMDAARERIKTQKAIEADKQKKREEYEAAMAKLEAEKPTVEVNNKKLDPETGEILADKLESEQAEIKTIDLTLELKNVRSAQTYLLRDYLTDNGFDFTMVKK
ncbi:DUF1351 domain-containing protein [Latilactobacillus sakei]|uniref:DUF1351 domain-containing protein n=1 Tax=Latilactobacillus sakei TaxID=1599 RepID=UPI003F53E111